MNEPLSSELLRRKNTEFSQPSSGGLGSRSANFGEGEYDPYWRCRVPQGTWKILVWETRSGGGCMTGKVGNRNGKEP